MSERAIKYVLMVALLVNGALALASLRRTEQLLERAVPKWEAVPQGRMAGEVPVVAAQRPGTVSHVHSGEVISAQWANDLVDTVNRTVERVAQRDSDTFAKCTKDCSDASLFTAAVIETKEYTQCLCRRK